MPRLPRKGDLVEIIELEAARDYPDAQTEELKRTLAECMVGRGCPGVTYTYHWLNARHVEVTVHEVQRVKP